MNENEALIWIADIFQEHVENISLDTPRDNIPGWDSLGILSLMAEMDETFDILLEDKDLENLKTVNDLIELLRLNGKIKKS